ncbi:MAG: hypothetical protein ACFE9L_14260 [Candidatus Hodarchaeota archaeon]
MVEEEVEYCSKCNEVKLKDQFPNQGKICLACKHEYWNNYYRKNKGRKQEQAKR